MSPATNMLLAEGLDCVGAVADAEAFLTRAVQLGADYPGVLARAARFELWRGRLFAGVQHAKTANDLDPEDKRGATNLTFLLMVMRDLDTAKLWSDAAKRLDPYDQAIAYWRAPNTTAAFDERRAYVEGWRARESGNRDWLRVSAEIELDFAQFVSNRGGANSQSLSQKSAPITAQRSATERAYEYFREYLERGSEASFDAAGRPFNVILRNRDAYTMINFAKTAEALGHTTVAANIWQGWVNFIHQLPDGPAHPIFHGILFLSHAKLGQSEQALDALHGVRALGGMEITFFDLLGVSDDPHNEWHGVGRSDAYLAFAADAEQNIDEQRALVKTHLPEVLLGPTP